MKYNNAWRILDIFAGMKGITIHLMAIPVLAAALALAGCNTPGARSAVAERIDALCSAAFLQDSLCGPAPDTNQPGAAVLVMRGRRTLFEKCYGCADLGTGAPITSATSFNIASVSKQFTAVAVLQLVEQGMISLDDSVAKYFPEFKSDMWKDIRIRHLLSHSSGVPDARRGYTREQRIHGNDSLALEYMDTLNFLHFKPGTQYEYMNPTFVLCGRLVERVSGEEFTQYVHDHILVPAGMEHTCYFDPERQGLIPNMSHAYRKGSDASWKERDYGEESFFATKPDGGMYTSVREFAKWEMAQRRSTVLKAETLKDAQSPHTLVYGSGYSDYQNRPETWYGYGWFIETGPETVVYHTGDNGGYQILAARYPSSKTLVLIFANRDDWDRWQLLQDIEEVIF